MYNNVVPLMLSTSFHISETFSGIIMSLDNILAIFLLPLFGRMSDRCRSPMGRRKPFIICGTLISIAAVLTLPLLDNLYAMGSLLGSKHGSSAASPGVRILFLAVLCVVIFAMCVYRGPLVALLVDVTPRALLSVATAITNLLGALGIILYLLIAAVLYSSKRTAGLKHINYLPVFAAVSVIMLIGLMILIFAVDEPRMVAKIAQPAEAGSKNAAEKSELKSTAALHSEFRRSTIFLLLATTFWFISFNSVDTWFVLYANRLWNMPLGTSSVCLSVSAVAAIVSYIPIGAISLHAGRKISVLCGIAFLIATFSAMSAISLLTDQFSPAMYVLFALVGIGWALINVNSFPMLAEMCISDESGKYAGYYYTSSMIGQVITPIVSGWLIHHIGYRALFPYAAITATLALLLMSQVKHGDTKSADR
ncbi:MAG: MFS transporter [Mogibacterium sp.]|nr:MFS transporter [Mogibacterium sp.]